MKILEVTQGSPEWLEIRAKHFTASEAPAMMGASKKCSRSELLRMKATGSVKEFSAWAQRNLLDKGHQIEAKARPFAEEYIGDDLFPVTAVDDDDFLLASYDGLVMMQDIAWECKSWNEAKVADVRAGRVPEEDFWQVVQHTAVGAQRVLYTVSDGTRENTVHVWYERNDDDIRQLNAGWAQFSLDLENYQSEPIAAEVVGRAPEDLPALHIEVQGQVTASNLSEFRSHALEVIGNINTELKTDNDFADAEKTVKWCGDVEKRLEAAKQHALGQTATIDELFRTIDAIREEARSKRLELEKAVKSRKQAIRDEILSSAKDELSQHIQQLNNELGPVNLPAIDPDFAGAMKNKRTIQSLCDAVDTVLAKAKIEANGLAEEIRVNLGTYRELAAEHESLFPDLQQIITKPTDDFTAMVRMRIADHEKAEKERQQASALQEEAPAPETVEPEPVPDSMQADFPRPNSPGLSHTVWNITAQFQYQSPPHESEQVILNLVRAALNWAGISNVEVSVDSKEDAA